MSKKANRKTERNLAVLWTVVTVMWAVTAVLRTRDGNVDVLTILVLVVTAVAAISRWYRYATWKE